MPAVACRKRTVLPVPGRFHGDLGLDEIDRLHKMELPVLVGTTNVDVSETLSRMLKRRGMPHRVLNAKHHKSESEIVMRTVGPAP